TNRYSTRSALPGRRMPVESRRGGVAGLNIVGAKTVKPASRASASAIVICPCAIRRTYHRSDASVIMDTGGLRGRPAPERAPPEFGRGPPEFGRGPPQRNLLLNSP